MQAVIAAFLASSDTSYAWVSAEARYTQTPTWQGPTTGELPMEAAAAPYVPTHAIAWPCFCASYRFPSLAPKYQSPRPSAAGLVVIGEVPRSVDIANEDASITYKVFPAATPTRLHEHQYGAPGLAPIA